MMRHQIGMLIFSVHKKKKLNPMKRKINASSRIADYNVCKMYAF